MDQSGVIVGGIAGAILAAVVFALIMVPPPAEVQPEISIVADEEIIEESTQSYSKELSLIEIFENSESGVVRVNVQKNSDEQIPAGVGSGFVFDKQGHIITNAHVVDGATKVVITFLDGREYNAEIIGADTFTDIAVVKVNADLSLLHPLTLGDSL